MVIDARHRLATVKQLPYDAEVEFLESDGGQYIDTEYIGNSETKVEISAANTNTTTYQCLMGARNSNGNRPSFCIWQFTSNNAMRFDYNSSTTDSVVTANAWNTLDVNIVTKDKQYNYVNGQQVTSNSKRSFTLPVSFYLFTTNGSGTPSSYYFVGKIYHCKIWDSTNTLVRDFIPVRFTNELGNTEGAMYDKVSGQLFRNQGSGEFVMGPDVIPYDAEVEYLESTGTQWIDTGIYADETTTADLIACNLKTDGIGWGFGARTGWANRMFILYNGSDNNYTYTFGFGSISNVPAAKTSVSSTTGIFHKFHLGNICSVDGVNNPSWYIGDINSFTTPETLRIFAAYANGNNPSSWRFTSVVIYKANVLIMNLIPVRIGTTGYMYDRANPKGGPLGNGLYPNQGSGDFILGKDVAYPKRKFEITYRKPFVSITPPLHYQGLHPRWTDRNVGRN